MSAKNELAPEEALKQVLQSLTQYFIPLRRLKVHQTVLGEGRFGTVKLADFWSTSWNPLGGTPTTVVVKELQTNNLHLTQARNALRLARDMKVWASCKHANILEFRGYHFSKDFEKAYLVSPYMKNGSVKHYIAREAPSGKRRLQLINDTANGLHYLHTRSPPIVHGDLKTLNILINDQGGALLSNFGLGTAIGEKRTGLPTTVGFNDDIRYCSPEALKTDKLKTPSDIWAWGCIALEIISDKKPYHGLSGAQAMSFICGDSQTRKSPEPGDTATIPPVILELLRECWRFGPYQRVGIEKCVERLRFILEVAKLDLFAHTFIPPTRIQFAHRFRDIFVMNEDNGVAILSLEDESFKKAVRVGMRKISTYGLRGFGKDISKVLRLRHENVLEFKGFSLDASLRTVYLISPYLRHGNILEYSDTQQLKLEARLRLLQGILKGLQYLHERPVRLVHGNINPKTVLVNNDGNAVICDIPIGVWFPPMEKYLSHPNFFWWGPEMFCVLPITGKADIWSWALVSLDVLCHRSPENASAWDVAPPILPGSALPIQELWMVDTISSQLLSLLQSCCQFGPARRPSVRRCISLLENEINAEQNLTQAQSNQELSSAMDQTGEKSTDSAVL